MVAQENLEFTFIGFEHPSVLTILQIFEVFAY